MLLIGLFKGYHMTLVEKWRPILCNKAFRTMITGIDQNWWQIKQTTSVLTHMINIHDHAHLAPDSVEAPIFDAHYHMLLSLMSWSIYCFILPGHTPMTTSILGMMLNCTTYILGMTINCTFYILSMMLNYLITSSIWQWNYSPLPWLLA